MDLLRGRSARKIDNEGCGETADDNSSTALMKEENQDWNLTIADVMIVGSRRAFISVGGAT